MVIVVVLLLLAVGAIGYVIGQSQSEQQLPPDPETELRAAIELHRIRRRFDAAWTKTEQRRDAARLRRQISEALKEDE